MPQCLSAPQCQHHVYALIASQSCITLCWPSPAASSASGLDNTSPPHELPHIDVHAPLPLQPANLPSLDVWGPFIPLGQGPSVGLVQAHAAPRVQGRAQPQLAAAPPLYLLPGGKSDAGCNRHNNRNSTKQV